MITLLLMLLLSQVNPKHQPQHPPLRSPRAAAHQANLNWMNTSCTTAKPCAIQVYRAQCANVANCPSYPNSAFATPPAASTTVTVTAGSTSTSWNVADADPALADSTTYVWVATNSFTSSPTTYSPASSPWSGTTSAPAPQAPPAPTVGGGNSIQ